jgi:hypothetical protein
MGNNEKKMNTIGLVALCSLRLRKAQVLGEYDNSPMDILDVIDMVTSTCLEFEAEGMKDVEENVKTEALGILCQTFL